MKIQWLTKYFTLKSENKLTVCFKASGFYTIYSRFALALLSDTLVFFPLCHGDPAALSLQNQLLHTLQLITHAID